MRLSPDARSPNHETAVFDRTVLAQAQNAWVTEGPLLDAWLGRPRQLAGADAPAEIKCAIVCRYPPRQNLLIPVTWGFVSWGECDLLKVEKSGYLTEFEIKTSVADLQREWKKKRWTNSFYFDKFRKTIRRYFIVLPKAIAEKAALLKFMWVILPA